MTHSFPNPQARVTTAIASAEELRLALEWVAGGDEIVITPDVSLTDAQALAHAAGKRVTFTEAPEVVSLSPTNSNHHETAYITIRA